MFGFPCEDNDCTCDSCPCSDPYTTPGIGGAGRSCPFTNGDVLVIAGGVLIMPAGSSIVYTNGPENETDTVIFTVVAKPDTPGGPSVIELRIAVDGTTYVYGRSTTSGAGAVTISVGSDGGELESREIIAAGGSISDFTTFSLCYKPPVQTGEDDLVGAGADTAFGDPEWELDVGPVENILTYDDGTYCSRGSLGDDEISGPIGVSWFPTIPDDAVITEINVSVRCREAASPGNGIIDYSAVATVGAIPLADKAASDPIPEMSFGALGYIWSGGDLSGITTADAQAGLTFGISFKCPLGTGGGTQPDVEAIRIGLHYTLPRITPGRLTFSFSGSVTECVTSSPTNTSGGGTPRLTTPTDGWQVTSVDIDCTTDACDICEITVGEPCEEDCCEDALDDISSILSLGPLIEIAGDGRCIPDHEVTLLLNRPGVPFINLNCSWSCRCIPLEESTAQPDLGESLPIALAYVAGDGVNCWWEALIWCIVSDTNDELLPDGDDPAGTIVIPAGTYHGMYAIYKGPNISGGNCQAFPVTLTRIDWQSYGSDDGEPPTELELDEVTP